SEADSSRDARPARLDRFATRAADNRRHRLTQQKGAAVQDRDEETLEPIEEHDVVDTGRDRDSGAHADDAAEREARAAAAEAAAIGGYPGEDYGVDEAERAVVEGGGGVAEGFEEAEHELI